MKFVGRLLLAYVLSFTLSLSPLTVQKAHAGMISTSTLVDDLARGEHEQNVANFLSREDVKKQLMTLGISDADAQRRVSSLSDRELKNLSGEVDQALAGGSVAGILIVVILVLLIIYLVKRV